jgi:hypothetical protein
MKKLMTSVLSSGGKISSKRFITLLAFLMMVIGFAANLFFDLTVEEFMYEAMVWIVLGGLGFTASEKFANRPTPKPRPRPRPTYRNETDEQTDDPVID